MRGERPTLARDVNDDPEQNDEARRPTRRRVLLWAGAGVGAGLFGGSGCARAPSPRTPEGPKQPGPSGSVEVQPNPNEEVRDTMLANISVIAGRLDRDHAIVSFDYPGGAGQTLALRDRRGAELPVQVDADGIARFVLPRLAAGERATFDLVPATARPTQGATASELEDVVRLSVGGATVVDFQLHSQPPAGVKELYSRGGYLHPLYTPGGVLVTGDYPEDHRHHHGIWSAWTRVEFNGHEVDFWNVQSGQGRVDLKRVQGTWQGPVHAGLEAMLAHVDLVDAPITALNERWLVRVYKTHEGRAPYFIFDLESTQTAATDSLFKLLEYRYGGFAIRGHEEWRDVANAVFLTSEGRDRLAGDDHKGRWCFIGGNVGKSPVGYAALGHPDNFRAPQKMRIHPTDPYMAFAPVKEGPFTIEPGTPYVTRLRFVSTDGAPDAALLDRLWDDYATPPEVTVTRSQRAPS